MKKPYLLLPLLAAALTVQAEQRSVEEAKEIASEKMENIGIAGSATLVESASKAKTNGKGESVEPYYVFAGDDGKGFVIVAAESSMPDIVGYSASGVYDEETMPDGLAYFLEAYADMAASASSGDNSTISRIMAARALRQSSVTAVSPLLGDIEWAQDEPYNSMCPVISGSSTVTGCVATAMGQIMMYHQWPESLQEDISSYMYRLNGDTVIIDAIEAGYTYDWDNMLPTYSGSYTDEEAEAVGALLYHCGASLGMLYAWSASSATNPYQEFVTYFGYDADTNQPLYAETYNLADWNEMILSELANGRPVFYTGSTSEDEGHAFVLDGVDSEGLYHVNWGWGGYQNGYFDITVLNPEKGGTGSGDAEDGYARSCYMIVGLTPDDGQEGEAYYYQPDADVRELNSISITNGSRSSESETFSLSVEYKITNYKSDRFEGLIAVGLLQSDGSVECISSSQTSVSISGRGLTSFGSATCDFTVDYAFPTGNSALVAIYSDDEGETWNLCGSGEYFAVVVNATETTLTEVDRTVSVTVEAEEELLAETSNQLKLTATNNLIVEFIGDLYVYISDSDTQPDDYETAAYLRIPSADSVSTYIDFDIDDADALYIWVEDEFGNILVEAQQMSVSSNEEPELTLLSFATNASDTDYDTENCYYQGYLVSVPKVYSDTLFITWTIENTGGVYRGTLQTTGYEALSSSSSSYNVSTLRSTSVTIPASSTYEHKDTLLSDEFDSPFVYCRLTDDDDAMGEVSSFYNLYLASSSSSYFTMTSRDVMAYFSDEEEDEEDEDVETGINDIAASGDLSISGGEGCISISAAESATVRIYTLAGQQVKVVSLDSGESASVSVPAGVYIAGGKKIIVK